MSRIHVVIHKHYCFNLKIHVNEKKNKTYFKYLKKKTTTYISPLKILASLEFYHH